MFLQLWLGAARGHHSGVETNGQKKPRGPSQPFPTTLNFCDIHLHHGPKPDLAHYTSAHPVRLRGIYADTRPSLCAGQAEGSAQPSAQHCCVLQALPSIPDVGASGLLPPKQMNCEACLSPFS